MRRRAGEPPRRPLTFPGACRVGEHEPPGGFSRRELDGLFGVLGRAGQVANHLPGKGTVLGEAGLSRGTNRDNCHRQKRLHQCRDWRPEQFRRLLTQL